MNKLKSNLEIESKIKELNKEIEIYQKKYDKSQGFGFMYANTIHALSHRVIALEWVLGRKELILKIKEE